MPLWQTYAFQEITLARGEGCTVWDAAGKPYLDLLAGTWCNVLGYAHPRWVEAVQSQVAKLAHVGYPFLSAEVDGALAKLREVLPPGLDRVVLANTGSEAVELALKMAHAATGAEGMAVIERGYYGATTYALALSEAGRSASYLPHLGNLCRIPAPTCDACPADRPWPCDDFACLDPLREAAESGPGQIAAAIYEPVMGVGGMIVPPPGYGAQLRRLTAQCDALLIAEEVTTGVGRTGRWFGFQHDDIVPDILVIGKALGAGLPVSAVVTTAQVEECCHGTLRHAQSHQNDPLSGHIAATVIAILQEEGLVERAAARGSYLMDSLAQLQATIPWVRDVRGKGLMVGVELEEPYADGGTAAQQQMLEAGFILDYQPHTAVFRLFPPYVIATEEIDRFVEAFERTLRQLRGP